MKQVWLGACLCAMFGAAQAADVSISLNLGKIKVRQAFLPYCAVF